MDIICRIFLGFYLVLFLINYVFLIHAKLTESPKEFAFTKFAYSMSAWAWVLWFVDDSREERITDDTN